MLLGAQLRRLREANGVTRQHAGWEIRASESKISRLELGRVSFKERDVADLLTLYGITKPGEREAMLSMAREANTPGWWHQYSDILASWFHPFLGLEAAAVLVRTYEVQFVPGLLQTRDYAKAVILLGFGSSPTAEIERRIAIRMTRQEMLTRPEPLQLWAIVDEAVLRRPIGGRVTMRAQIASLVEATKLPNIVLQVLPFEAGGHAAAGGAFTILRFPDQELPDVVYLEQINSAVYLDKRDDVDQYAEVMERAAIAAEPPERTVWILERIMRELD